MVDFRYHLVSLVSVFLALALGIILGAGPLQNSIGNTLQDQVTELRTSRNAARAEAQQAAEERNAADAALDVAASQLVGGMLAGRSIAVIVLPDAGEEALDVARGRIEQAGGQIVSKVSLSEGFTSSANSSYRNALAGQMAPQVEGVDEGAEAVAVLTGALDTIMRRGTGDERAQALIAYFSSIDEEHQLMRIDQEPSSAADAVLLIVPEGIVESAEGEEESDEAREAAEEMKARNTVATAAYQAFASRGPTVAIGEAGEGTLLMAMRPANTGSTVDSPLTIAGAYNAAFALAAEITGQHVDLGSGNGANAPFGTRVDASKHED